MTRLSLHWGPINVPAVMIFAWRTPRAQSWKTFNMIVQYSSIMYNSLYNWANSAICYSRILTNASKYSNTQKYKTISNQKSDFSIFLQTSSLASTLDSNLLFTNTRVLLAFEYSPSSTVMYIKYVIFIKCKRFEIFVMIVTIHVIEINYLTGIIKFKFLTCQRKKMGVWSRGTRMGTTMINSNNRPRISGMTPIRTVAINSDFDTYRKNKNTKQMRMLDQLGLEQSIIITIYIENFHFFHAKLRSDLCPPHIQYSIFTYSIFIADFRFRPSKSMSCLTLSPKSSCSCPCPPFPQPPHFFRLTQNHLHAYALDYKTISICHTSPHQP